MKAYTRRAFISGVGSTLALASLPSIALGAPTCQVGSYFAQYYRGTNFEQLAKSRCEAAPLNKNWGSGTISPLSRSDNVSARWTGEFQFQAGEYEFSAIADDGIRVYVDGVRIIDEWRDQAATTFTARRQLSAGTHQVKVEYYERLYNAQCSLSWSLVSTPQTVRTLGAAITTGGYSNAQYTADINTFNQEAGHDHPVIVTYDAFGEYGLGYGKMDVFEATNTNPVWTWEPKNVSLASINSGAHDGWIDAQASHIASYPNRTVYIRFAHEMNGNWYSWGQQPTAYRSAFQRVYDRVHSIADNAELVWCPNIDFPITEYYPGSSYVDWLALDAYNMTGDAGTPQSVFFPDYDIVSGLDSTKPMMIPETGCLEYPGKANWITDLYTNAIPNLMPRWKIVCWFDVDDPNLYPQRYHLDSSASARSAYNAVCDLPQWQG